MDTEPTTPPADDGQPTPATEPDVTPPADTGQQTADELKAELERTRLALKNANKEAADRRKKLEAFEAAEKEKADKELSESQRLQKRLDEIEAQRAELENKLRLTTIHNAALAKAAELGFENTSDALALTDLSAVEITEDGKATGFEKQLEALAKSGRLQMKAAQSPRLGTPRAGERVPSGKQPDGPQQRIVRF